MIVIYYILVDVIDNNKGDLGGGIALEMTFDNNLSSNNNQEEHANLQSIAINQQIEIPPLIIDTVVDSTNISQESSDKISIPMYENNIHVDECYIFDNNMSFYVSATGYDSPNHDNNPTSEELPINTQNSNAESNPSGGLYNTVMKSMASFFGNLVRSPSLLLGSGPSSIKPSLIEYNSSIDASPCINNDPSMSPSINNDPSMSPSINNDPSMNPIKNDPSMNPCIKNDPSMNPCINNDPSMSPSINNDPSMSPSINNDPSMGPPINNDNESFDRQNNIPLETYQPMSDLEDNISEKTNIDVPDITYISDKTKSVNNPGNQITIKNNYTPLLEEDLLKINSLYNNILFLNNSPCLKSNKLYSILMKCFVIMESSPVDCAVQLISYFDEIGGCKINLEDSVLYSKKKVKKVTSCSNKKSQSVWCYIILLLNNAMEAKIGNDLVTIRAFISCCIVKLLLEIENLKRILQMSSESMNKTEVLKANLSLFTSSLEYTIDRLSLSLASPVLEESKDTFWLFYSNDGNYFNQWNTTLVTLLNKFRIRITMDNIIELLVIQYNESQEVYNQILVILKQYDFEYRISISPLKSPSPPIDKQKDPSVNINLLANGLQINNLIDSNSKMIEEGSQPLESNKPKQPLVRQNSIIPDRKRTITNGKT